MTFYRNVLLNPHQVRVLTAMFFEASPALENESGPKRGAFGFVLGLIYSVELSTPAERSGGS